MDTSNAKTCLFATIVRSPSSVANSSVDKVAQSKTLTCRQCKTSFATSKSMFRHEKDIHGRVYTKAFNKTVAKQTCAEDGCDVEVVQTALELRNHLNKVHGCKIQIFEKQFPSEGHFLDWKAKFEEMTFSSFFQNGKSDTASTVGSYYYCNRSGRFNSTAKVKRAKVSCKTGVACTAFIRAKLFKTTGRVVVRYCASHYKHEKLLKHLRLSPALKMDVARKLKAQMTTRDILAEYRNCVGGNTRASLITSTDIRNIAQSFSLRINARTKIANSTEKPHQPNLLPPKIQQQLKQPQLQKQQQQEAVKSILASDVSENVEILEKRTIVVQLQRIGDLMDNINLHVIALGKRRCNSNKLNGCIEMLENVDKFLQFGPSFAPALEQTPLMSATAIPQLHYVGQKSAQSGFVFNLGPVNVGAPAGENIQKPASKIIFPQYLSSQSTDSQGNAPPAKLIQLGPSTAAAIVEKQQKPENKMVFIQRQPILSTVAQNTAQVGYFLQVVPQQLNPTLNQQNLGNNFNPQPIVFQSITGQKPVQTDKVVEFGPSATMAVEETKQNLVDNTTPQQLCSRSPANQQPARTGKVVKFGPSASSTVVRERKQKSASPQKLLLRSAVGQKVARAERVNKSGRSTSSVVDDGRNNNASEDVVLPRRSLRCTTTKTTADAGRLGKPKLDDKMDFIADLFGDARPNSECDHNYTARPAVTVSRPGQTVKPVKTAVNQILVCKALPSSPVVQTAIPAKKPINQALLPNTPVVVWVPVKLAQTDVRAREAPLATKL